jgi:hypothetical protein
MAKHDASAIAAQRARCATDYRWFIDSKDPVSMQHYARELRLELQKLERMLKENAAETRCPHCSIRASLGHKSDCPIRV